MSWSLAIRSFIPTPREDHTQWRESSKAQAEKMINENPTNQIKRILASKDREIRVEDLDYLSKRSSEKEVIELIKNLSPVDKYFAVKKIFSNRRSNEYTKNLAKMLEELGYQDRALTHPNDSVRASYLDDGELAACCGYPQHK